MLTALVVETVQGEGGITPARTAWLRALVASGPRARQAPHSGRLQMGCARTGPFFSFEPAGMVPDIVRLSKSISGYGNPMALTLMRPEHDVWKPGEHNGTFRGYNPAFVTAARALGLFWSDDALEARTTALGEPHRPGGGRAMGHGPSKGQRKEERMSVDLVGFLGVVLVAYVVPGPDFLVVLRSATEHPAKGRAAALGAQTGLCVHMLAAAVGLSLIAARSPVVYDAIKLLGAAYLVHLGIRAVLAARRAARERRAGQDTTGGPGDDAGPPASAAVGPARGRWRSGFTQGLLTNALNPKAALFFLSILPQFVQGGGSPTRQIFFLGILDVLIGVAYWFVLVAVAVRLRTLLARPKIRHRWELTTGWLFIAIGIGVAAAS
ncbi:LysE family transporter [Streptomyces sp. NPDC101169]|uniref:LysE family transporter n=1 Tax=Streptomyces sp. NPDC101169 TaxID=3366121 RepID=UPI003803C56E